MGFRYQLVSVLYACAASCTYVGFSTGVGNGTPTPIYLCPVVAVSTTGDGNIRISFIAGSGKSYVVRVYSDPAGNSELFSSNYINAYSSPQNVVDDFNGNSPGVYYVEVREVGSVTPCTKHQITLSVAAPATTVSYSFLDDEPTDLPGTTFSNSFEHVPETDIIIPTDGIGPNKWLLVEYPAAESDFTTWRNTATDYGTMDDQIFEPIVTIGAKKYIKSRVAFSINPLSGLTISH